MPLWYWPRAGLVIIGLVACDANTATDSCEQPALALAPPTSWAGSVGAGLEDYRPAEATAWRWQSPGAASGRTGSVFTGLARFPLDESATAFGAIGLARVRRIQCRATDQSVVDRPDTTTDDDGRFVVICPSSHPVASGIVELANQYATVGIGDTAAVTAAFGAEALVTFPMAPGRAFAALTYLGPVASERFGVGRPAVTLVLDAPGATAGMGRYLPDLDRIEFGRDALGGFLAEEAFFRAAHEYGHAFHAVAIEPWASYRCEGGTHAFRVPNTLSCAFVEGFAHFFAAFVGGARLDHDEADPNFASDRVIEENLYRTNLVDGARTPGLVAAFLYDLADGAASPDGPGNTTNGDETFDEVTLSGVEIARVMRGCRLTTAAGCPAVTALDGIDQLIYCAEGAATGGLGLRWRTYHTVEGGGTTPVWNAPAIRALWQRNLFPRA